MKKSLLKTLFGISIVIGLTFFYAIKYTSIKIGSGKTLFYNPFGIDETTFKQEYNTAVEYLKQNHPIKAAEHFGKAIKYSGTHNEKTREQLFSCGNDYWEYKQEKLLKYSNCYLNIGMIDSAMSCLEPALYNFEKRNFPTEKIFFSLAISKYGKEAVLKDLRIAIQNTKGIDCFMCTDYYFEFKGIKIGLDRSDTKLQSDTLLKRLIDKYKI